MSQLQKVSSQKPVNSNQTRQPNGLGPPASTIADKPKTKEPETLLRDSSTSSNESEDSASQGLLSREDLVDIEMREEPQPPSSECPSSMVQGECRGGAALGRLIPIKQVQEVYQKFLQLKTRGPSQGNYGGQHQYQEGGAGGGSLTNPGTEVFLVDQRWIDHWKAFSTTVGRQSSFCMSQKGNNSDEKQLSPLNTDVFIEYLTNSRLLIPQGNYLTCNDEKSPYSSILRPELNSSKEYQQISKDQWQLLEQHYAPPLPQRCHSIRRYFEKSGVGIRTQLDSIYPKLQICLFAPQASSHTFAMSKVYETYFSGKRTWAEFKVRIMRLIKDNQELATLVKGGTRNVSLTKENIRIWSCTTKEIGQLREKYSRNLKADKQSEENKEAVTIQIQGSFLENFSNHIIDQMLPGLEVLLLELNDPASQRFILSATEVKNSLILLGQCQFCSKTKNLSVQCRCYSVSYCSEACQTSDVKFHQDKCTAVDTVEDWDRTCVQSEEARLGLTGLKNLKNSCYMSSSIQCLSHAVGLTKYFLQGHFTNELNYKNPLGAKGQLAIAYAKLLKQLWYDDVSCLAPWHLKKTIGKFSNLFNNFDQQDSQELLNFMLDGLHEDLNRVQHKPIVPQIESEGLDDEKDSEESWQNHLKRNQSIIVDLMHGQFKSTVKCPDCEKLSITFDPYMSVSLPIPEIKIVEKQYYWVPYDTSKKCILDSFKLKSLEQIKTLRKYIAQSFDVHQEQFELIIIQDEEVKRILPRYEQVSSLNVNNIFIFAMETSPQAFQITATQKYGVKEQISNQTEIEAIGGSNFMISQPSSFLNASPGNQWNEKKGASELCKKLKPNYIQVIMNIQIFKQLGLEESEAEKIFPRILYLRLDESLIEAHLDIFEYLKPLFTSFLEHKQGIQTSSAKLFSKKNHIETPPRVDSLLWNTMTLSEQYQAVFGQKDPSRKKLSELPYFLNVLTRNSMSGSSECVYCQREQCNNCPLPFEEITLREYLNKAGVSTQSYYYYEEHLQKQLVTNSNKADKKKTASGGAASQNTPSKKQQGNLEFVLQLSINSKKCWALYENLARSKIFSRVYPEKAALRQNQNFQNDKVTIDDCFRQFMTPEKLTNQNTWFCNRCKMHKHAVKKIQIFKTPPILVINLKRFKGMQQKQNTPVQFPIEGLDMSNFVISQKQKESEDLVYDLFGVSNHYGTLQAGHYTAYAKNDGDWYKFNDENVDEIENPSQIVSGAAYNLFYARRDIDFENLNYSTMRHYLKSEQAHSQSSPELLSQPLLISAVKPPNIVHKPLVHSQSLVVDTPMLSNQLDQVTPDHASPCLIVKISKPPQSHSSQTSSHQVTQGGLLPLGSAIGGSKHWDQYEATHKQGLEILKQAHEIAKVAMLGARENDQRKARGRSRSRSISNRERRRRSPRSHNSSSSDAESNSNSSIDWLNEGSSVSQAQPLASANPIIDRPPGEKPQ